MIVGDLKPLSEIASRLTGFRTIHVVGCNSCVTVCRAGGDREARDLARELARPLYELRHAARISAETFERQCERDLVQAFLKIPAEAEAILSLACGVGVQVLSDVFDPLPVLPALNTTFMGGADEPGIWREKCSGCGDCVLAFTAAVCPVSRCAKKLLNGPCGGSRNGSCEVDPNLPCAWSLIFYRLKKQNQLHLMSRMTSPRDWRGAGYSGPRERRRKGVSQRNL